MKFILRTGGVPTGQYQALFRGAKYVSNKFGRGLVWGFEIVGGEHAGELVTRTTTDEPTLGNQAGRLLLDLAGLEPQEGLEIEEKQFRGQTYKIEVTRSPEGNGTRVERIAR